MRWISKHPPPYFHPQDTWIKEPEYSEWMPNMERQSWDYRESDPNVIDIDLYIQFPKKTNILKSYCE